MRALTGLLVVLVLSACGKKDAAGPPLAVKLTAQRQEGLRLELAFTTEPGARLSLSVDAGTLSPAEVVANGVGQGAALLDGVAGAQVLTVRATSADGSRSTTHALPFTMAAPEVPVFEDATPPRDGAPVTACTGAFPGEPGLPEVVVCPAPLRLAEDFSVGLRVRAGPSTRVFTLGDARAEFKEGVAEVRLDLKPLLAALTTDALGALPDPLVVPATLEGAHGTKTATLRFDRGAVEAFLLQVTRGGARFTGEGEISGHRRSLLALSPVQPWEVQGDGVTLAGLDLVAVLTASVREAPPCRAKGNPLPIERKLRDLSAVVYERRTGKERAKKAWKVKAPGCAEWIKTRAPFVDVEEREVSAWLAAQLKPR